MKKYLLKIISLIANIIFLTILARCIFLADEMHTFSSWINIRAFYSVFIVSPIAFTIILITTHFVLKSNKIISSNNVLLYLNTTSALLLSFLLIKTLTNANGLWLKIQYVDFGIVINYCFHPYVGGIGIYITIISYFSYRLLAVKNKTPNSTQSYKYLLILIPTVVFFLILFLQQYIDKPPYDRG